MVYKLLNERFVTGQELVEFIDNNNIVGDDIKTITSDDSGCDLFYWRDILN